jgi:AcrR family transcriptional regulator
VAESVTDHSGSEPPNPGCSVRERALEALLDLATERGYENVSLEDLLSRAGLTRVEFDAHFRGLQDCALQLVDSFFEPIKRQIQASYDAQERWPDSLRAASYVVADWIATNPREVRFGAIELPKVGEIGKARREEAFKTFTYMIDAGRAFAPDPSAAPDLSGERAIGSVAEMLTKALREPEVDPHAAVPQLMYLAVLPYLGPEAAMAELNIPPPGQPSADRKP